MFTWLLLQGCSDRDSHREFQTLDRAISTLASATREDRPIRLDELRQVSVTSDNLKSLKKTCVKSHEHFVRAEALLAAARLKTDKVEKMINAAKQKRADGGILEPAEELTIRATSDQAAASLKKATIALDEAETLTDACKQERRSLRTQFTEP